MSYRLIHLGALFTTMLAIGCTDDTPHCDAAALHDALETATSGQVIEIGACSITGSFVVPPGVTLAGAGQSASTLVAENDEPAVRILPGDTPTMLEDLTVTSDERVALLTIGPGRTEITRVDVEASRGIALGAEDLTELSLDSVNLSGPVTSANAMSVAPDPSVEDTATVGAIIASVDSATFSQVSITGFASRGVIAVASDISWQGGGAPRNLGTGLLVYGGSSDLRELNLGETFQGVQPLTIAGIFAGGATIESSDLVVNENEGLGLLHNNVTAHHADLQANDNADVGLWVQRCPTFELSGSTNEIASNRFSGIALFENEDALIAGARIERTASGMMVNGDLGTVNIGDGIHAISPESSLVVRDVELTQNERVGVLLDLSETEASVAIENVTVDGTGEQYGVIVQLDDAVSGWDEGVSRSGSTGENDTALASPLPTISVRFDDEYPGAELIVDQGVAGIIGDSGSH